MPSRKTTTGQMNSLIEAFCRAQSPVNDSAHSFAWSTRLEQYLPRQFTRSFNTDETADMWLSDDGGPSIKWSTSTVPPVVIKKVTYQCIFKDLTGLWPLNWQQKSALLVASAFCRRLSRDTDRHLFKRLVIIQNVMEGDGQVPEHVQYPNT